MLVKDTVLKLKMAIPSTMANGLQSIIFVSVMMALSLVPVTVYAHGTDIRLSVIEHNQVEVQAQFDTGERMANAQILVYAADNPQKAWLSGSADKNGVYRFKVDTSIAGSWAVSVRTAGHGELLHFVVDDSKMIHLTQTTKRPFWQTVLLLLLVVGILGAIAKYFTRAKSKDAQ